MSTEAWFKQEIRDWIIGRNAKVGPGDFADDTPLIEQRIITSLQVMDLVLFLEELTGRLVDVEQLKPGVFRSVNAIYQNFGQHSEGGGN